MPEKLFFCSNPILGVFKMMYCVMAFPWRLKEKSVRLDYFPLISDKRNLQCLACQFSFF